LGIFHYKKSPVLPFKGVVLAIQRGPIDKGSVWRASTQYELKRIIITLH
jgi:hypothetical protein